MREMTTAEREWMSSLSSMFVPAPPWTEGKAKARSTRDNYVCYLYEQGIHVRDIADAAALSTHAIVAIIRRMRSEGRHVVRPRAKASTGREPYRRDLTEEELATLRELDGRVRRQRGGRRFMWSPEGHALLSELQRLREDRVALATLAGVLGITRQAVHSMTSATGAPAGPAETD